MNTYTITGRLFYRSYIILLYKYLSFYNFFLLCHCIFIKILNLLNDYYKVLLLNDNLHFWLDILLVKHFFLEIVVYQYRVLNQQ